MRKKKEEEHENQERWLISYADFITLLFAFFVVMYSTSSVHEGKYRAVSDSVNEAFHPVIALSSSNIRLTSKQSGTAMFDTGLKLFFKYRKMEEEVRTMDPSGQISLIKDRRGTVIRIENSLAFETGQAEILPVFSEKLDKIADLIAALPNPVQVEGHTDNIPIKTPAFPSNWELSTGRAMSIVRYFVDRHAMDPQRFSVAGYGEFRPIDTNDSPEGRAKNRRVEIVVVSVDRIP
ncbi:MAG: OmpA family protein [Nitrospirae bacterium]|nr:OmpA family protein [Nitrospirota bacterium]